MIINLLILIVLLDFSIGSILVVQPNHSIVTEYYICTALQSNEVVLLPLNMDMIDNYKESIF